MWIAIIVFTISLLGVVGLFSVKAWENRTMRVLAPRLRTRADEVARELKVLIVRAQQEARKLPPEFFNLARTILHDAALGSAALARYLERQSHRVADKVSHRGSFERRESKNDFLKNVRDYKQGGNRGLDTSDESGQNT